MLLLSKKLMVKLTKYFFDTRSRTKNAVIALITTNTFYVWIKIGSAHKFLMSVDLDFQTPNES